MKRSNPMPWLAGGSLLALGVLTALLYVEAYPGDGPGHKQPIRVYCAASMREVMEAISTDYERKTGERVALEFGDSARLLGQATIRLDGDLFLPADESYVRLAEQQGLVARSVRLCQMQAVILCRRDIEIETFADLLRPGLRLGIANPERAAIGKVVRNRLTARGVWREIAPRIDVQHFNVTDAANAVQLRSRDVTFVWDVVARNYPELTTVQIPELEGAIGRIELALLGRSPNPDSAERFARHVASSNGGLPFFRQAGFLDIAPEGPRPGGVP